MIINSFDIVPSTFLCIHKVSFWKLLLILQFDLPKSNFLIQFIARQHVRVDEMPTYRLFQA